MTLRQIIFDTETTGLDNDDRIIELAGVELIDRKETGRYYHQYVCPKRQIHREALKIHGITEEFLADKPSFPEIIEPLLDFIKGAQLVIHNAPFDIRFLNYEFQLVGPHVKKVMDYCSVLDTLSLAKKKHPGQQNSLDALCKRYGVDRSARKFHGALLDANLLAAVYLAMTGGQTSLFGDDAMDQELLSDTKFYAIPSGEVAQSSTVIFATESELSAHQQRLADIKQASGGICIWSDEI